MSKHHIEDRPDIADTRSAMGKIIDKLDDRYLPPGCHRAPEHVTMNVATRPHYIRVLDPVAIGGHRYTYVTPRPAVVRTVELPGEW